LPGTHQRFLKGGEIHRSLRNWSQIETLMRGIEASCGKEVIGQREPFTVTPQMLYEARINTDGIGSKLYG